MAHLYITVKVKMHVVYYNLGSKTAAFKTVKSANGNPHKVTSLKTEPILNLKVMYFFVQSTECKIASCKG